ncbi:MAG TPA: hypothetical protein PKZ67_11180, partial [Accumulibacter sp.]|nr:hypothetical protein [Accumulibacter sp.]
MESFHALRLGAVFQAQRQGAAAGVGKGAEGFQRLAHHLARDALGLQVDGLRQRHQFGDQGIRLR